MDITIFQGFDVNILVLVLIGLGAGILSGFAGVGGAFIITPALIVIGFPANMAVGTGIAWVLGSSVVGTFRHASRGNIDFKLGIIMVSASILGVEIGVRLLNLATANGLADEAVLAVSLIILVIVGIYTLNESLNSKKELEQAIAGKGSASDETSLGFTEKIKSIKFQPVIHFQRSKISISVWVVLLIGFSIGLLAGFIGVGGGFILVPSLIYLVGMPSILAVGTSLFQTAISAGYGAIRHTLSGNVILIASFIMLIASSLGVQFGVHVTRYVRGLAIRFVLSVIIILNAVGVLFKLLGSFFGGEVWSVAATITIFTTLGITVLCIAVLFVYGRRYQSGKPVPGWILTMVAVDK